MNERGDCLKRNKTIFVAGILFLSILLSWIFVTNNAGFYQQTVVKITKTTVVKSIETTDATHNKDRVTTQELTGIIKNGAHQGDTISLENDYSLSGAHDEKYRTGDELFVSISKNSKTPLDGSIDGVKRDKYLLIVGWIFILAALFVGKKSGVFSIISLILNVVILSIVLDYYIRSENGNLLIISMGMVVLFTVISLFLVSGNNRKTYAAIISTLIGTFISFFVAYGVMNLLGDRGLRYEEMQFLTRAPRKVFLAGVLIGSLGAVMDIAIIMASAVQELVTKNKEISKEALVKSGMEIGKDIMGAMTNVLFFAYISGAVPMVLLYLKNGAAIGYTLSMNLSLELARALAGSIGIVLTIPIGLYISIYFIHKKGGIR